MKKENIIKNSVIPGTIALSTAVLAMRIPFAAEAVVGFSAVAAVAGIAALEYRIGWKF